MWFLYSLIYVFIGLLVIYYISGKSSTQENSAWVIAYAFGIFLWPIVICGYLYNKINKKILWKN